MRRVRWWLWAHAFDAACALGWDALRIRAVAGMSDATDWGSVDEGFAGDGRSPWGDT